MILDAAGEQVRALLNEGEQLLELEWIDPGMSAEEWLVLRLHQSGDDCNLLWEYETLDIDIRIEDENDRRIDRVSYGRTATAKGETNPPGKKLTWSIPTQTDGVDAEIEADSGIITVKPNSGDGWIVVRATHQDAFNDAAVYTGCMNCKNCDNASGGFVTLSSVDARLSMGKAENGLAAGHVTLVADSLSGETYTPKALGFSTLADGVEALRDSNGFRQVMAPEALADVVALGDDSFEVRFYSPGDVEGKSGGFYETDQSATPMAVWRVENPSEGDGFDRLKISEIRDGRTTAYEFSYDDESREWSLQEGNGLRTAARRETTDISRKERAVAETVRNVSGEVASATRTVFRDFGRGESVVEETVDPDGAALTTTYEYFEDSSLEGSFGKVKSVERPDGSWTKYLYDDEGRIASETSSWLDLAAGATSASARTVVYDYEPVDPNDAESERNADSPRTVVEYIEGKAVSRTFHSYMEQPDGGRIHMVERCADPDASFGDPGNLRTVTWHNGPDTAEYEVGRVAKVLHPDGRTDTYAYETGTWFDGSFRPGDGSDIRQTIVCGTEDFPEGIPGKTTMDVSVSYRLGRSIASETHVRTEDGWERISWTEYVYDQRGNQVETRSSDGSRTESVWGCCGKESDRNASGILTTYEYDDLRRLVSSSRESLNGDIVTSYEYDATGRRLSQTVSAGGLSLTDGNEYDSAGRLVRTVDAAGLATTYQYSDDGLTTTVTRPGGATETTERHLDGQVESVTGTAVVDRYYFYGVDPDGTRWTETRVGRPDSPMFERTRTDCLGRTVKTETAAFEGASKTTEYEYDDKGRLIRTSTTGQADTLYAYDELGNQHRSGLDIDGNSQLILASDDRITESETAFAFVDDAWWQRTVQTVYPESGIEDSVEVSESLSRLTGLGTDNLVSESVQIDIHGKRTVSRSHLDRETRTRTDTVDHPDSDTNSVTVSQYGLTVSSTSKTGLTTTFGYDALGRRTETTDPRTGTSLAHYDASGRPDWTEDAAGNRTSYSYDPSTGLKIAEYNPEGKATRHIHNARGQVTQTWGDVPYPVRYVYDEYGRLAQMHTFRTGENWSFGMWPTGLEGEADVTTWHYDEASGLLAAKEYADGTRTTYTYTPSGNIETRTWARLVDGNALTTTYAYDPATSELTAIDYSDSTPDIAFAYDRLGRQKTITDAAGTRTFAYDEYLRLKSETLTGPINHTITRTYDSAEVPGRSTGFTLATDESTPDSPEYSVTYGYDESGRFETLSWNVDADPASDTNTPSTGTTTYSYLPDSDLLQGYATSAGGPEAQQTTYAYEPHRNLKTMVDNAFGTETISRYEYEYDTLGRRTTVLNTGAAFDQPAFEKYRYDDRSQLVSAARYLGSDIFDTGTPVDDRHRDYAYDPIGNRIASTEGAENPDAPEGSRTLTYTSNQLNQYDLITETNGSTQTRNLT